MTLLDLGTLERIALEHAPAESPLREALRMESKDVIARLCRLQSEVAATIGPAYQDAADCFCGEGGFWEDENYDGTHDSGYRNDAKALEFIEAVVRDALTKYIPPKKETRLAAAINTFFHRLFAPSPPEGGEHG